MSKKPAAKKGGSAAGNAISPFNTPRAQSPKLTLLNLSELPVWNDGDLPTLEKTVSQPFSDPANATLLPSSDHIADWQRASRLHPEKCWTPLNTREAFPVAENPDELGQYERPSVPCLECCASTVETLPIVSTISACISAAGHLLSRPDLGHAIFPQNEAGLPIASAGGRHWVKLFCLGQWRRVEVDDALPVDGIGRMVLPRTSLPEDEEPAAEQTEEDAPPPQKEAGPTILNEYWAALVAKALLKVLSRNFSLSGQDMVSFWVHCLTGYVPTMTESAETSEALLSRMREAPIKESFPLVLCVRPGKAVVQPPSELSATEPPAAAEESGEEVTSDNCEDTIVEAQPSAFENFPLSQVCLVEIKDNEKFLDFSVGHSMGYGIRKPAPVVEEAGAKGGKGKPAKDKKGAAAAAATVSQEELDKAAEKDAATGLVGEKMFHLDIIGHELLCFLSFTDPEAYTSHRKYIFTADEKEHKDTVYTNFQQPEQILLVASVYEAGATIELQPWSWAMPLEPRPMAALNVTTVASTWLDIPAGEHLFKVRGRGASSFAVQLFTSDSNALPRSAVATPDISHEDTDHQIKHQLDARSKAEGQELGSLSFNTEAKILRERQNLFVVDVKGDYDGLDAQRWSLVFRRSFKLESPTILSFHLSLSSTHLSEYANFCCVNNDNGHCTEYLSLRTAPQKLQPNKNGYTLVASVSPPRGFTPGHWKLRTISDKPVATAAEAFKAPVDMTGEYVANFFHYLFRYTVGVQERSLLSARVCFPVSGERQDGLFTLNGSQPKLVLELLEDGTVISSASGKGAVCLGAAVVEPPPKGTEKKFILQCTLVADEELDPVQQSVSEVEGQEHGVVAESSSTSNAVDGAPEGKSWSLRAFGTGAVTLKPNTDLEDYYTSVRQGWEKAQPGRAAKGKQSRTKFLDNPSMVEPEGEESARVSDAKAAKGAKPQQGKGKTAKEAAPVHRDVLPVVTKVTSQGTRPVKPEKEKAESRRNELRARLEAKRLARTDVKEAADQADSSLQETLSVKL